MATAVAEERVFKVNINITKHDDSSPVFFKIDGQRFKESQTLKLQVDTTYRLSFEFRPAMEISEISVAGGDVKPELKKKDKQSSHYECIWSTQNMSESKKNNRFYLLVSVKFQDGKQLNAQVQCKMYSLKDKNHVMWGTCLKNWHMDCKTKDGQRFVDIQQILFK